MDLPRQIDLRERQLRPELMDQPDVDPVAHAVALQALARINWLSRSYRAFWIQIRRLIRQYPDKNLRVLDVACGGGDVAVSVALAARRANLNITVDGCDLSDTALTLANQRATKAGVACRFFQFDVLQDAWPNDYDVICCSLFLHHLPTDAAQVLLSHMAQSARRMVLINDLIRSRLGYFLARAGTLILTRSPIVHYDGPVSVAGAFTPVELRNMADRAGMTHATIHRLWPERMLLVWNKP